MGEGVRVGLTILPSQMPGKNKILIFLSGGIDGGGGGKGRWAGEGQIPAR